MYSVCYLISFEQHLVCGLCALKFLHVLLHIRIANEMDTNIWKKNKIENEIPDHIPIEVLNEVFDAESKLWDLDNVTSQQKFSCWDVLDLALFDGENPKPDHRIYVHGEVLVWIVEYINDNMLNEKLRATVEEVHHHNLNGPVYLINFYNFVNFERTANKTELISIKNRFKYNMPWRTKPTYFLRTDLAYIDRKVHLLAQLKQLNLDKCFHETTLDVNWLYIPQIQVYEFSELLTNEQIAQIDSIFENMSKSKFQAELYICDQFIWHQYSYEYIEVDKVAMDMCVEEWRRYDLLNDFSIDDILRLDLANKDYRDPYMNEYLDRYLDILLQKSLPERNIIVPLVNLRSNLRMYFVSRFYNRISCLTCKDPRFIRIFSKFDILCIRIEPETIVLKNDCPSVEEVVGKFCIAYTTYEISNYVHFSNSLFRVLLKKFSWQQYNIRFDDDFKFNYECHKQYVLHMTNCINWTTSKKRIFIKLQNCAEHNVVKLVNFVKYLIDLFNETQYSKYKVTLCFTNCILDDYTFLENMGNGFKVIKFKEMKISSRQIQVLSRTLKDQSCVKFRNCAEITDNNVMTLLENIEFNRLRIEGENACTPGIYFRMAEHLMSKKGVDTIMADQFNGNMLYTKYNFYYHFKDIEFFNNGHQIVARNRHSKEMVDLYCFINDAAIIRQKS